MKTNRVVIKIGGASLQTEPLRSDIIRTIREYQKYDYKVVLVHGGGPSINAELTRRGIQWEFIKGQRKTTLEMVTVIEDVLFNEVNSSLVRDLNTLEIPSMGLSGANQELLFCEAANAELGYVGVVKSVNLQPILSAVESKVVPVIAPIGIGAGGEKYNINADWAAAKIAAALNAEKLVFLTDQTGILDEAQSLIPFANREKLQGLVQSGVVSGGMYTKVLTVIEALEKGVAQVRIMGGHQARNGLWSDFVGTFCSDVEQPC